MTPLTHMESGLFLILTISETFFFFFFLNGGKERRYMYWTSYNVTIWDGSIVMTNGCMFICKSSVRIQAGGCRFLIPLLGGDHHESAWFLSSLGLFLSLGFPWPWPLLWGITYLYAGSFLALKYSASLYVLDSLLVAVGSSSAELGSGIIVVSSSLSSI